MLLRINRTHGTPMILLRGSKLTWLTGQPTREEMRGMEIQE